MERRDKSGGCEFIYWSWLFDYKKDKEKVPEWVNILQFINECWQFASKQVVYSSQILYLKWLLQLYDTQKTKIWMVKYA